MECRERRGQQVPQHPLGRLAEGNDHVNSPARHCQGRAQRATVITVAPDGAGRSPLPD
jgi:hypothetical protein